MALDQPTATLIAALTASVLSLLNLWWTHRAGRRGEMRTQYRDLLKPYVADLGEALHQIVASATVAVHRKTQGRTPDDWLERSEAACTRLKELRVKAKYPLWRIEDGLRQITRVASWIKHNIDRVDRRDKLLAAAEELRVALDDAVREAYLNGCPPGLIHRWTVAYKARKLRQLWDDGSLADEEAD